MDSTDFQKMLAEVKNLSPEQFKALVFSYAHKSGQNAKMIWNNAVYTTLEQHLKRLGINRCCPKCGSTEITYNGLTDANIQRYLCKSCKTGKSNTVFTLFSGTLLEKSHYPWEVWVEVLRLVLTDHSIDDMKTRLEKDFGCYGIDRKTLFYMRLKLMYAMTGIEPPMLGGVIQMDETFIRESQKGHNLELFSPLKGYKRKARYGRQPSKLGIRGPEFATILTAVDNRGYCICKVVCFGNAEPDSVIDMIEENCTMPAYVCSDKNPIYNDACELLDIPHYEKPSQYNKVLEKEGYIYEDDRKSPEEIARYNQMLLEKLYKQGLIDKIQNREDISYTEFTQIKKRHKLNLARVNELHSDIKLLIEKQMTNVATKYLQWYIAFFTYRRNWRVKNGYYPTSTKDAEEIFEELLRLKLTITNKEIDNMEIDIPKPSGRKVQLLKEKTEMARRITRNKYFKFDGEDIRSFNTRAILNDTPQKLLRKIGQTHDIPRYTRLSLYELKRKIEKLPDIDDIIIDLITEYRHYEIAEEDRQYIESAKYRKNKKTE